MGRTTGSYIIVVIVIAATAAAAAAAANAALAQGNESERDGAANQPAEMNTLANGNRGHLK